MSVVGLRPWSGVGEKDWESDTVAVQHLLSRLWPRGTHPGGLGWESASVQLPQHVVLAESDHLVGWAGVTDGDALVQVEPGVSAAGRELLAWAVDSAMADSANASGREGAGSNHLTLVVADGDQGMHATATEAGFTPAPNAAPWQGMFRAADQRSPVLPSGYRFRNAAEVSDSDRVAVHRKAWRPAQLPWPEGAEILSEEATSSFTHAAYQRMRRCWLYEAELDLVAEAPDGSLAACCTVWWDPANRCAEIEPLGVVPEHRRLGLAAALCDEASARVAARGGEQIFINTWPMPGYPAPGATYLAIGFQVVRRGLRYECRL
jgi:GNAT superfamily N-acetyltransferase